MGSQLSLEVIMKTLVGRFVLGCAFALPTAASADIFRCVSSDGETTYSDAPCPDRATLKSNISATLDHCTTAECVAQREKARLQARERLKEERQLLSELTEARLKAEALHTDRMVRLEELRALEERNALERSQQAGVYYPAYGFGGIWPDFDRGLADCTPPRCNGAAFKHGFAGKHQHRRFERAVSRNSPVKAAHRRKH
jgi:hypothetical protein